MILDPRVALVCAVLLNLMAVVPGREPICWIIFALTLIPLLRRGRLRWALSYGLAFGLIRAAGLLAAHTASRALLLLGGAALMSTRYLLPVGIAVDLYVTVSVGEVIAALRWCHAPQSVVIPVAVLFRAVPAVVEEGRAVWEAHLLREALHGRRQRWAQEVEDVVVPVLMSMLRMGDVLTAAALVRGLGSARPTCATALRIRPRDGVVACTTAATLIGWVALR